MNAKQTFQRPTAGRPILGSRLTLPSIAFLAFALTACSKSPSPSETPAVSASSNAPVRSPTDWNDDEAKKAIASDSGDKNAYVCVLQFPDMGERQTAIRTVDRPQIGMRKISANEESVLATSAEKAHDIMEIATSHSLRIGACSADLASASVDKSIPLSSYTELRSGLQVALAFYGLRKEATPTADLAQAFDPAYQSTNDSFKKADLLKGLAPAYAAEQQKELALPYFKILSSAALGHYDPATKSFPLRQLGLDGNSWLNMPDNPQYGVVLRGDSRMLSISEPDESAARALEAKVGASGRDTIPVDVDVYLKAADTLSYAARRDVVAKVVALHVQDQNGQTIADIR